MIPNVLASETAASVITNQVRESIEEIDYYLVENLRNARRYLRTLGISKRIEDLQFEILDKRTPSAELANLMKPAEKGKNIGIISESGCPGVADPGAKAIAFAHKSGMQVIPLVGPSSILMALMASGFNGQAFAFHGYLPVDKKELGLRLKQLDLQSRELNQTQIFIETPHRNNQMLKSILDNCQTFSLLCIAKNITGPDEFIATKQIAVWKHQIPDLHKVPTVFLLHGQ